MAEQNDPDMAEVMALLEAEPANAPAAAPGPDIPALCEQQRSDRPESDARPGEDVVKHHKRYETYVGAKTAETLIESFLSFTTKALGLVVKIKDADALKNELKND